MGHILLFLVELIPFALLLCAGCSLAIWLVFGRAPLLLRMPLFLMGTLALGAVLGAADNRSMPVFLLMRSPLSASGLFAGLFLAVSFSPTTPWYVRILAILPGGSFVGATVFTEKLWDLDSSWIVRSCLAATCFSLATWGLRFMGLRVVLLAEGISDRELESATGKDLDEWFAVLDSAQADAWPPAHVVARIRGHGVEFRFQKVIADAYLRSVGRRGLRCPSPSAVPRSGKEAHREWSSDKHPFRPQFTTWQLLLTMFCAACLLGFLRPFGWHRPTLEDARYAIPAAFAITVVALATLVARLAVRTSWRKTGYAAGIFAATATLLPAVMGITTWRDWRNLIILAVAVVYVATWIFVLTLVRRRGIRAHWE